MSRFFAGTKPTRGSNPTRFGEELKEINDLINNKLRPIETNLANSAMQKGPGSIDFSKQLIISHLLDELDRSIAAFNDTPQATTPENKIKNMLHVIKQLGSIVNQTLKNFRGTLLIPRNTYRETTSKAISYSTYLSTAALVTSYSLPLVPALFAFFFVAPRVNKSVKDITGIQTKITTTVAVLESLSLALDRTGQNLGLAKSWMEELEEPKQANILNSLFCPITGCVFKEPVICLLDNQTYEKDDITRWLNEHRTSPFNRNPLSEDQTVESVLTPNPAIRDVIQEYIENNSTLFIQSYRYKMG